MTFEKYKELIESIEHAEIYREVKENENSETISHEDAMSQLQL